MSIIKGLWIFGNIKYMGSEISFGVISPMIDYIERSLTQPYRLSSHLPSPQDAPEFESLHFMATFQQAWKEISWRKPPQHENEHSEGSLTGTLQTQAGSNTDESSTLGHQLSQISETGIVAEGSFGIPNTHISTQTADQYLQMAEDMGDYLTWEPFQIDISGTNNFIGL